MILKTQDVNTIECLHKLFDKLAAKHIEPLQERGYYSVWFTTRPLTNNGSLIFIRHYSSLENDIPNSYNPYKDLDQWINFIKPTNKDYIYVASFGNGFLFGCISDMYNIMED